MKRLLKIICFLLTPLAIQAQDYNSALTNKARFIAGIKPPDALQEQSQRKAFQTHQKEIVKAWRYVKQNDLNAIQDWRASNATLKKDASSVLFYPFSGPDFLYAHAFFPDVNRIIMGGLEDCGTLPEFQSMQADEIKNYLFSLRYSFRYMNKVGYFVTKQMMDDFKSGQLDGVVHVMAFYLIRTGHYLKAIRYFHLNGKGAKVYHDPDKTDYYKIRGMEISFVPKGKKQSKSIVYFNMDLSDANLQNNPAFVKFMKSQGAFSSFLKSASYLLHNDDFSTLRNFILNESNLILQDPTGVPYKMLKKAEHKELKLYGSYSAPISDFSYRFQPKLKKDAQAPKVPELPFRVGYGSWNNETLLMLATDKTKDKQVAKKPERKPQVERTKQVDGSIVFKVQFYLSQYRIAPNSDKFRGLEAIAYYKDGNAYKYTTGSFKRYDRCKKYLQNVKEKGFADAFIVAFKDGSRVPVSDAIASKQ